MTDHHPSEHVTCCACGEIVNGVGIIDWPDGKRREFYHATCWLHKHGPAKKPRLRKGNQS